MTYRDDREALEQRARLLEDQLTSARREGEAQGREAARPGPREDQRRFTLQYSDIGTRTGRPQAQVHTPAGQAEVWSDNLPRFRVGLRVPAESEPTERL